ncbi:hypothetical protein BDR05DRAFT_1005720 [Suillus weaverae]|nr:hypothetical protein BDR05DRAFT_1005720 [Suillus weaverae]
MVPCFEAPAPQSTPVSLCVVQTLSSVVPAPPDIGLSVPPAVTNIVQLENDPRDLNSIYIFLTPSFAPDADVQYVEVYEDEQLYAKVADEMADECMVHYHCGTLYNVPAKSVKGGVHPPFFFVTCGRYIGVFSGWDNVEPIVDGIRYAVYAEVESLEDGERESGISLAGVYTSGNDSDTGDDVQRMIVKEGDNVAIFPDDQRAIPTEDGSLPAMGYWYGKVNDIYVARNSQDAWINIQWYYRRVDLEDECVDIAEFVGDYELVRSDHKSLVDMHCIEDHATIQIYDEADLTQCEIPPATLYCRWEISIEIKAGKLQKAHLTTLLCFVAVINVIFPEAYISRPSNSGTAGHVHAGSIVPA